ncbi:hypothetical protein PIB30_103225, partial [Stylosanthes scabra]|nr:hypothetical protein [Stylosanthes scabra]
GIRPIYDNEGALDRIVVDLGHLGPISGTVGLNSEGRKIQALELFCFLVPSYGVFGFVDLVVVSSSSDCRS